MKIYIGNMSFETTEDQLRQAFGGFGAVSTVTIITDRESGQSKGFAFVEMPAANDASAAISGLNGQDMNGRALKVSLAKSRDDAGNRDGANGYRKVY